MSYIKNYYHDEISQKNYHSNERLNPDYQEFLDAQEPTIKDRDESLEALIAESVEVDDGNK